MAGARSMVILVRFIALAMLIGAAAAAVALQQGQPPKNAVVPTTPTAPSTSGPIRPTHYGINLTTPLWWNGERAFMNLAAGGSWSSAGKGPWAPMDPSRIDPSGNLRSLQPGEQGILLMTAPAAIRKTDLFIHCSFEGKGAVAVFRGASPFVTPTSLDFTWQKDKAVAFVVNATDPADPIRNIDCREQGADRKALFHPAFLASIKPFHVMRFLDWQQANMNQGGNWAKRTPANASIQAGPEGVAVENLVALANQTGVNPWFVMPWNADDDYMRNFARYVHDHLDPKRTVYLEIGNEAWNVAFPVGQQLLAETKATAPAGKDLNVARMERYAQRTVAAFKVWEEVYRDDPKRLVRILSGQAAWPELIKPALAYKDTVQHVDALASAPYFGQTLMNDNAVDTKNMDALFSELDASIAPAIQNSLRFKTIAEQNGLRYLAYEAGQHVTYRGPDLTAIERLNKDPRMAVVYRKYMDMWRAKVGDVMMMFASVGPISRNAAWGLSEYEGQPLPETPKRRAVLEAIAAVEKVQK